MSHARAWARFAALGLVTAAVYALFLGARLAAALGLGIARRRQPALVRAWARAAAAILGLAIERRGHAPPPPCFLVSNHLSYVDVVVYWNALPCVFLAKSEVARWPIVGWLARSVGTLFIDRARRSDLPRAIRELERALAAGSAVVVFPEGTSSSGERVLPFHPSLFEVASKAGLAVRCASISYSTPPGAPSARESVCWWGDMSFLPHFYRLLGLRNFRAIVDFAPEAVVGRERKELARAAERAVGDRFRPVPG